MVSEVWEEPLALRIRILPTNGQRPSSAEHLAEVCLPSWSWRNRPSIVHQTNYPAFKFSAEDTSRRSAWGRSCQPPELEENNVSREESCQSRCRYRIVNLSESSSDLKTSRSTGSLSAPSCPFFEFVAVRSHHGVSNLAVRCNTESLNWASKIVEACAPIFAPQRVRGSPGQNFKSVRKAVRRA